jgi:hypothetical protein
MKQRRPDDPWKCVFYSDVLILNNTEQVLWMESLSGSQHILSPVSASTNENIKVSLS